MSTPSARPIASRLTLTIIVGSLLLAMALGGCGTAGAPQQSTPAPQTTPSVQITPPPQGTPSPALLTLVIRQGEKSAQLKVEVADNVQTRSVGLSRRKSLPADQGMLFVFEKSGVHHFWMKDTYVPLSIAFITTDGQVIDVQDMQPLSEDHHYPSAAYQFGLEANQGYFQRHGLGVGSRVTILMPGGQDQALASLLPIPQ